ncbi:MAG: hypothetical protein GXC73_11675, partial [Chitinophagaceae bacterium]|nr:hypothetical protein [Chitinophagaceae bacterium]
IANPHVFYAEIPGDDGTFTTQKILLVKTEIALRLKNSSAAKEIEIVEFVHEDKKVQLFKSRLH